MERDLSNRSWSKKYKSSLEERKFSDLSVKRKDLDPQKLPFIYGGEE